MFTLARSAARWAAHHVIAATAGTALLLGAAGGGIGYAIAGHHGSAPSSATASPLRGADESRAHGGGRAGKAERLLERVISMLAGETGQTAAAVRSQLEAGQSVDQIAGAKAPALEAAILAQVKKVTDRAVGAGRITPDQETSALAEIKTKLDALLAEPGTQLLKDAQQLLQVIDGGRHGPKGGAPATAPPSPAA